ncbi:MAG: hypothetical protein H6765_04785 [Candidatus Peribacteria bacterium]|nr:MAG: hypothetical protein H6765_04785 [Candidatus Peribacteria bacterium]
MHPNAALYLTTIKDAVTIAAPVKSISQDKQAKIALLFTIVDRKFRLTDPVTKRQMFQTYLKALDAFEPKLIAQKDIEKLKLLDILRDGFNERLAKI